MEKKKELTCSLGNTPPRHRPDRILKFALLPQDPRQLCIVTLSIPFDQKEVRRKGPVGAQERETNGVRRDRRRSETLHAVVVEEAAVTEDGDGAVDSRWRVGFDVAGWRNGIS